MPITIILFDLDCTLYPKRTGLQESQDRRITEFIQSRLGVDRAEADGLRRTYWSQYGATVQGLVEQHGLDPADYYDYIGDVPLDDFLTPDPRVDDALARLPQRKMIFSNSSRRFAESILDVLQIRRHFERIYAIEFLHHRGKPNASAYRQVLADLGVPPQECLLVDDVLRNLLPARQLGMATALVAGGEDGADLRVNDITELPEALARFERREAAGT
jgi:putative hydrolase of the HAD superfamily